MVPTNPTQRGTPVNSSDGWSDPAPPSAIVAGYAVIVLIGLLMWGIAALNGGPSCYNDENCDDYRQVNQGRD